MLEQAILPVVATGRDGSFRPVGTCWIFSIADDGQDAWAFSAAHVFQEVVRSEGRHERSASSTPDILRRSQSRPVALQFTYLNAIYRSGLEKLEFVKLLTVYRDDSVDVAVCHLMFPPDSGMRFSRKLAIHSGPVAPGTKVAAVGFSGMGKSDSSPPFATLHKRLTFEHGECVEYFPQHAPPQSQPPCFKIDVSTEHGMSGGPILHKGYGDELVGCGVISRGTSFGGAESTIASALWPVYSFSIPNIVDGNDAPLSLLDLARIGDISDKANGPEHFRFVGSNGITWV